jgi:3-oxoacyl-[acyl-carrier protein] reductase
MASKSEQLLEGKVALITGTNRGIGRAMLETFARNGAVVYANARAPGTLEATASELGDKYGAQIIPVYFDVTDGASLRAAFARIQKEQKRLDVLVNNAGVMRDALIGMVTNELMNEVFSVNVYAVIHAIQYASKLMARQKSGSIVNVSSIVGVNGNPGQIVYSASKGAVISLTKTAAKELAPLGVRVNAIAPGMIDTAMFHSIGEDKVRAFIEKVKMGRLGSPADVANTALYLASDLSEYVTGQIIGVDGAVLV